MVYGLLPTSSSKPVLNFKVGQWCICKQSSTQKCVCVCVCVCVIYKDKFDQMLYCNALHCIALECIDLYCIEFVLYQANFKVSVEQLISGMHAEKD